MLPPAWVRNDVWPTLPPDISNRSQPIVRRCDPRSTMTPDTLLPPLARTGEKPVRCSISASTRRGSGSPLRLSATATTISPALARSTAAWMPSSAEVTIATSSPGAIRNWLTSRRAAPPSITPGRSLLPNTSGCSIEPVAITISPGRKRSMLRPS